MPNTNHTDRWSKNYSKLERNILQKHKKDYLKCETPLDRKAFVGRTIFPALCAAWRLEAGQEAIPDLDKKIEKLLAWIRNNWRLTATKHGELVGVNIRPSNVVAQLFAERVEEKAMQLMEEAHAANRDSTWIGNWATAVKHIKKDLTDEEKELVNAEIQKQSQVGLSLEGKRKFCFRHLNPRLDQAANKNFMEMDVLTLTFVIQRNKDGEMQVDLHDKVAYLLGLPESFNMTAQARDQVRQFKVAIADYFVNLKKALERQATMRGESSQSPRNTETELMDGLPASTDWHPAGRIPEPDEPWFIGEEGYPLLKRDFDPSKVTKLALEDIMRRYISLQYLLATGGRRAAVPWEQIQAQQQIFFEKKYLPRKLAIKAPRDMPKEDIVKFLRHILKRQEEYKSPKDIFRFSMITGGRGSQSPILPTAYSDDPATDLQPTKQKPRKQKPRQKRHIIPNSAYIALQPMSEPGQMFVLDTSGTIGTKNTQGTAAGSPPPISPTGEGHPPYPDIVVPAIAETETTTAEIDSATVDTNREIQGELLNNKEIGMSTQITTAHDDSRPVGEAIVNEQNATSGMNGDTGSPTVGESATPSAAPPARQKPPPLPRRKTGVIPMPLSATLQTPYMVVIYNENQNVGSTHVHPPHLDINPDRREQQANESGTGQMPPNLNINPDRRGQQADTGTPQMPPYVTGRCATKRSKKSADDQAVEEAARHGVVREKRQRKPTERLMGIS
ncbi:hypothetical protein CPC08DRAFT_730733 [Agrocybe pediades]|nr:hypothetical protein CPC08DRAFT_730733 [Agrocybe pediades]